MTHATKQCERQIILEPCQKIAEQQKEKRKEKVRKLRSHTQT